MTLEDLMAISEIKDQGIKDIQNARLYLTNILMIENQGELNLSTSIFGKLF